MAVFIGMRTCSQGVPIEIFHSHFSSTADLLGNIQQALSGLQGFDVMALELIQNADDAGAGSMIFDVRDEALIVSNDKRFTTCGLQTRRCIWENEGGPDGRRNSCNFHAISRIGSLSKVHEKDQTGRFGIGFVSVYQITDSPTIRSSGLRMRLDPLNGSAPTEPDAEIGGTEFTLPWASTPSETRKALNASPMPADNAELVADAISAVLTRGLFFLRHLHQIELRRNGAPRQSAAICREDGIVTLKTAPDGHIERWRLLTRSAEDVAAQRDIFSNYEILSDLDRSLMVEVAVPISGEAAVGLLYAYLPTEQFSGLPLHINADFFPHNNRRSIILTGESHERYWNELLLDTAAVAIGEAFLELRDLLGCVWLWELGKAAFELRERAGFNLFWSVFGKMAKVIESVWTVGGAWKRPELCVIPPEKMVESEQLALEDFGLNVLHRDLRPFSNVLASLGVQQLRLQSVVEALEERGDEPDISADDPHLRSLWSAIDLLIAGARHSPAFETVFERLKAATFILDSDGNPASINALYRSPDGVDIRVLMALVADCPLVHSDVSEHRTIHDEIDILSFDDLAFYLANSIVDEAAAAAVIGTDQKAVRRFYDLLTAFEPDASSSEARNILRESPILRTHDGFVSPSRGQLPGGFVDLIGHFQLIDAALMGDAMRELAEHILGVEVLTFKDYIQDHLERILSAELSQEQYKALLMEIVDHARDLDASVLKALAERDFVRTRAGGYARPDECYFWSAELEILLGANDDLWANEAWMPAGSDSHRFRDLLEDELGMQRTPAVRRLVDRLEEIDELGEAATIPTIVKHLLDRVPNMSVTERDELERLQSIEFLPGRIDGERVEDELFTPTEVFRSFRAPGFESQVPIVDVPALRVGSSAVMEFLELLDMPEEPATDKVVSHLEHCMAKGLAASDVTYAILSERLEEADAEIIDRLRGKDFIFDAELGRYISSDTVFWQAPPLNRWRKASSKMVQREDLFRRLGIQDFPEAKHYAALLAEIAGHANPTPEDATVHDHCLAWLADALERGSPEATKAVEDLRDGYVLLARNGTPVWSEDAAWVDSEWLVEPFGTELDDRLVTPPNVPRPAAARLFTLLGVAPLSDIARQRLASASDQRSAPEATERLRERADLLLWLAPTDPFSEALSEILTKCEVCLSSSVMVRAEITEFDPPVSSPTTPAAAFFDRETSLLHIRAVLDQAPDWSAAFRAVFFQLDAVTTGLDIPPIVMTAAYVTSLPSWSEAKQALLNSDYRPRKLGKEIDAGGEVRDAADGEELAGSEVDESDASAEPLDDSPHPDSVGRDSVEEPNEGPTGAALEIHRPTSGQAPGIASNGSNPPENPEGTTANAIGKNARDDSSGTPTRTGGEEPFKSKTPSAFGAGLDHSPDVERPTKGPAGGAPNAGKGRHAGGDGGRRRETNTERLARRSRMLTYVAAASNPSESPKREGSDTQVSGLIDTAAIEAALKYERARGWLPEEQPHGNPGYDVVSRTADGSARRLIEVKGLDNEWTQRGVKLSRVQYGMAETHPEEFWIYVVEHARDLERQKVNAIANPFSKVEEYWFDDNWRILAEEYATAGDLNIRIGGKVEHHFWGRGTIVGVSRHGLVQSLTIDFGSLEGKHNVPYSAKTLKFVD